MPRRSAKFKKQKYKAFMRKHERAILHLCLAKPNNMPETEAYELTGMNAHERDRKRNEFFENRGRSSQEPSTPPT